MNQGKLLSQVKKCWGIEGKLRPLYGELDLNFLLDTPSGKFILKLNNPNNSTYLLNAQNDLLVYLEKAELPFDLPRLVKTEGKHDTAEIKWQGQIYTARVLTWIEGDLYSSLNCPTPEILLELGEFDGRLQQSLVNYKNKAFERDFHWIPTEGNWVSSHTDLFSGEELQIVEYFLGILVEKQSGLKDLRKSVIYMDANDNNIVVSGGRIKGFIDFGDVSYTYLVNELAVTLAYGMMNFQEPLRAGVIIAKGFHNHCPLTEKELEFLYVLIAARLLESVTLSALRKKEEPENEYLQISEKPAWDLLKKWRAIHPDKAHAFFRCACGYEAIENSKRIKELLNTSSFAFPLGEEFKDAKYLPLDLSVGSKMMGNVTDFADPFRFEGRIKAQCEEQGARYMAGGYLEPRMVYSADQFYEMGNWGKEWRTVHLGHDYWRPAGSPVYAVADGVIHSAVDNQGTGNYGPTIILRHEIEGHEYFVLYGHLSRSSLQDKKSGESVSAGEKIGELGNWKENGNWVPHLHFQVILSLWGETSDFLGVAYSFEKEVYASCCPDPTLITGVEQTKPEKDVGSLKERRSSLLGSNLSVSYKNPLHMRRGYMQFLFDHDGRRYLDTVNNVAHVGHQHPVVVNAIKRQASVLNTNTRYLHEEILEYAEELTALFPDPLNVCFFVNSGSEANELALRMARTTTGRYPMIAMEMGYHGNTAACVEVSSYKFDRKGGSGKPDTTYILPSPDPFRKPDLAEKFEVEVNQIFEEMDNPPAGIIAESILSCAGQVVPPAGYYKTVYDKVRSLGGLFIADEVQVGFGRVGEKMWGFELHGITPDIVTLGKPIGNGHPLGAVVTTREIADAFANGMEFFNTYGGNPVSCSVGRAVLQVIKDEGLQAHALTMGNYIKEKLESLRSEFDLIADIRGNGLFLGFELFQNGKPATMEASRLVNQMRTHGVLMSTDGPDENVIKIKPPMCIQKENVDYLMEQLRVVISDL